MAMDPEKKRKLEAAGWKFGVDEFSMTAEEVYAVDFDDSDDDSDDDDDEECDCDAV